MSGERFKINKMREDLPILNSNLENILVCLVME